MAPWTVPALIPAPASQIVKACGMVVAAGRPGDRGPRLQARRAAELGAADDRDLVGQAAPLQVLEQAGDRLVDPGARPGVEVLELGVRVPLAVVAEIDQREPHPALDQPPRGEQPAAVDRRGLLVDAVEPLGLGRLAGQVERLGHRGLHPEGQLVRLDPGPELVVLGILDRRRAGSGRG